LSKDYNVNIDLSTELSDEKRGYMHRDTAFRRTSRTIATGVTVDRQTISKKISASGVSTVIELRYYFKCCLASLSQNVSHR